MNITTEQLIDEIQKPIYREEPLDVMLRISKEIVVNYIFYFENGLICTLDEDNEYDEAWTILEFLIEFQDKYWVIN